MVQKERGDQPAAAQCTPTPQHKQISQFSQLPPGQDTAKHHERVPHPTALSVTKKHNKSAAPPNTIQHQEPNTQINQSTNSQVRRHVSLHARLHWFVQCRWRKGLACDALVEVHVAPRQLLNQLTRSSGQDLVVVVLRCVCAGLAGWWMLAARGMHM